MVIFENNIQCYFEVGTRSYYLKLADYALSLSLSVSLCLSLCLSVSVSLCLSVSLSLPPSLPPSPPSLPPSLSLSLSLSLKNGASKICGRQSLKYLKSFKGCLPQIFTWSILEYFVPFISTHVFKIFQRLSFTNLTPSILEYFVPYAGSICIKSAFDYSK